MFPGAQYTILTYMFIDFILSLNIGGVVPFLVVDAAQVHIFTVDRRQPSGSQRSQRLLSVSGSLPN